MVTAADILQQYRATPNATLTDLRNIAVAGTLSNQSSNEVKQSVSKDIRNIQSQNEASNKQLQSQYEELKKNQADLLRLFVDTGNTQSELIAQMQQNQKKNNSDTLGSKIGGFVGDVKNAYTETTDTISETIFGFNTKELRYLAIGGLALYGLTLLKK